MLLEQLNDGKTWRFVLEFWMNHRRIWTSLSLSLHFLLNSLQTLLIIFVIYRIGVLCGVEKVNDVPLIDCRLRRASKWHVTHTLSPLSVHFRYNNQLYETMFKECLSLLLCRGVTVWLLLFKGSRKTTNCGDWHCMAARHGDDGESLVIK